MSTSSDSRDQSISEIYNISPFEMLSPATIPSTELASDPPPSTMLGFGVKPIEESLNLNSYKSSSASLEGLDEERTIGNRVRSNSEIGPDPTNSFDRPSFSNESSEELHLGGGTLEERRPGLIAIIKAGILMIISALLLYLTLSYLLPPIRDQDRAIIKIPRSFEELKALNGALQFYKSQHYWRVIFGWSILYMFLQAFSIPGSMYLSILGGAMFGVVIALPLVCFVCATGASLCYLISKLLGPALLTNSEKWRIRLDGWRTKIGKQQEKGDLFSYLVVLRISPLPPHWVVNLVAPHLGIPLWQFWSTTFLGIAGVSYIHVTIGTTLDQMSSKDDFHLISWTNFLGLAGIVIAVLAPVLIRRYWKSDLDEAADRSPIPTTPPPTSPSSSSTIVGLDNSPNSKFRDQELQQKSFKISDADSEWVEREGEEADKVMGPNGKLSRVNSLNKASKLLGVKLR